MNFKTGLIIFVLLFLVSCNEHEKQYSTYEIFGNGYQMECAFRQSAKCGVYLSECKDGREYQCLNNVIKVK